jgi:hypothetical protein
MIGKGYIILVVKGYSTILKKGNYGRIANVGRMVKYSRSKIWSKGVEGRTIQREATRNLGLQSLTQDFKLNISK